MNTLLRYASYIFGLLVLIVLPDGWWRLAYLHGITVCLSLFANDQQRFYMLLAMFHSAIHHLWPFLKPGIGYDCREQEFYDVFCHMIMIWFCFQYIKSKYYWYPKTHKNLIKYITYLSLIGSVLNCISVYTMDDIQGSIRYNFFTYTTLFQAVSTGYWIATMLWFNELYNNNTFVWHWICWIALMCVNWLIYKCNESMMGLSMTYRYVEGVFMVCTWIAVIANKMSL